MSVNTPKLAQKKGHRHHGSAHEKGRRSDPLPLDVLLHEVTFSNLLWGAEDMPEKSRVFIRT